MVSFWPQMLAPAIPPFPPARIVLRLPATTMSNRHPIHDKLKSIPLFHDFTDVELEEFLNLADPTMYRGGELIVKTLRALETGSLHAIPQDISKAKHTAPKIFRENCKIDWSKTGTEIHNFIRGLSPYPAAWTMMEGKIMKIFAGVPIPQSNPETPPGNFHTDNKTLLEFTCADGKYRVQSLQLEGKKRMTAEEFLRGRRN